MPERAKKLYNNYSNLDLHIVYDCIGDAVRDLMELNEHSKRTPCLNKSINCYYLPVRSEDTRAGFLTVLKEYCYIYIYIYITCIHTYIHTYIHNYIYIYIYLFIYS